jgi:hypothetical protein
MQRAPKALMTKIDFFFKNDPKWLDKEYDYISDEMRTHFLKYNTTKAVAELLLSDISKQTF